MHGAYRLYRLQNPHASDGAGQLRFRSRYHVYQEERAPDHYGRVRFIESVYQSLLSDNSGGALSGCHSIAASSLSTLSPPGAGTSSPAASVPAGSSSKQHDAGGSDDGHGAVSLRQLLEEKRYDHPGHHLPVHRSGKKKSSCVVCTATGKKKNTNKECAVCQVALCYNFDEDSESSCCFITVHSPRMRGALLSQLQGRTTNSSSHGGTRRQLELGGASHDMSVGDSMNVGALHASLEVLTVNDESPAAARGGGGGDC